MSIGLNRLAKTEREPMSTTPLRCGKCHSQRELYRLPQDATLRNPNEPLFLCHECLKAFANRLERDEGFFARAELQRLAQPVGLDDDPSAREAQSRSRVSSLVVEFYARGYTLRRAVELAKEAAAKWQEFDA